MTKDRIAFASCTASADAIFAHLSCGAIRAALRTKGIDIRAYAEKLATHATTFEAWRGDRLVGLIAAYFNDSAMGRAYISNVSVLDEECGKGIASALLRTCLDGAAAAGFDVAALEAIRRNAPAMALYERFGFQEYGGGEETVRMKLPLAG